MKKYTLSESKLREIIRESVKNALEEGQGWNLFKNSAKDVWKGNRVDPEKGEYKNYIKSGNAYGFDASRKSAVYTNNYNQVSPAGVGTIWLIQV